LQVVGQKVYKSVGQRVVKFAEVFSVYKETVLVIPFAAEVYTQRPEKYKEEPSSPSYKGFYIKKYLPSSED